MTVPAADRPLTAGDVHLLREGDVLRCTSPGGSLNDGEEVAFVKEAPRERGRIYLSDRDYHPFLCDRFTFVRRPAASDEGVGDAIKRQAYDLLVAGVGGFLDLSSGRKSDIHGVLCAALASPPVSERERELEGLFAALCDNSWDLRCFNMPTGGDDYEIGWRVIGHWQAEPCERTIAEVFHDDPVAAVRAALTAQPAGEPTHG